MLLIIDNYDSFTYSLVQMVGQLGAPCAVRRNDALSAAEATGPDISALILSPGPKDPAHAGVCIEAIRAAPDDLPIFGVCLGHQAIGAAYGGDIVGAQTLMHGKVSRLRHTGRGIFSGAPERFEVARYHSLSVAAETLPADLEVTATADDGEIMGLQHRSKPQFGVQFHPESIASEEGGRLLRAFLGFARQSDGPVAQPAKG